MSATRSPDLESAVDACEPTDGTPVSLRAESLESTAPDHLLDLKRELGAAGLVPAELAVDARFDRDCSFATQDEADRVREYVRAASFLGASTVTVDVASVADEEKVRPALAACAERARREGVVFEVDGPVSLES